MKYISTLIFSALLFSCKKKTEDSKPLLDKHPFAGVYKLKSASSKQYLNYYQYASFGITEYGVDIYLKTDTTSFDFIPSKFEGAYFVKVTANPDKYLDLNNKGYTYLTIHDFQNSTSQLFSVEPIYTNADRYYIRSVQDTSRYLVSKYSNAGLATTTALYPLNLVQWDCIWILEKRQ